jgi:hypothetical protein
MTDTTVRIWDTLGLPPRTEAQRCARHRGMCAYRDDDPARCTICHRAWPKIATDDPAVGGGTPEVHVAWHAPRPKRHQADPAQVPA